MSGLYVWKAYRLGSQFSSHRGATSATLRIGLNEAMLLKQAILRFLNARPLRVLARVLPALHDSLAFLQEVYAEDF